MAGNNRRNALVVGVLLGCLGGMVALVAASVPLYQMFCRVTGYGGTPRVAAAESGQVAEQVVTIRFDASIAKDVPWRFQPEIREMKVRLGENALAHFQATNTSDRPVIGTATFNVTPNKAAPFFNKIECFCFTQQRLEPGQSVDMPVSFFVDPAMATDPDTNEVRTITLSYTFFRAPDPQPAREAAAGEAPIRTNVRQGRS